MSYTPEQLRAAEENFAFQEEFRGALKRAVRPLPFLRTLDYGAGSISHPYTHFMNLHSSEEIDVFDTNAGIATLSARNNYISRWTNSVPWGRYDLVVCHFSLHHMDHYPRHVIRDFGSYNPKFVAVAEYDYTGATEEEFRQTFVADQEGKELYGMWRGDIVACFRFHASKGRLAYREALVENGYEIIEEGVGQGVARYKFFLVGQTTNRLSVKSK